MLQKLLKMLNLTSEKNNNNDIINMNSVKQMMKKITKEESKEIEKIPDPEIKYSKDYEIEYHEADNLYYGKYLNRYIVKRTNGDLDTYSTPTISSWEGYFLGSCNSSEKRALELIKEHHKRNNKKITKIKVRLD